MKKKFFITTAIAALMGVSGYLGHSNATHTEGLSDLELANAEALAWDPEQAIGFCDTYCKTQPNYVCVLITNYGFPINCHSMVDWPSFPVE